MDIIQWPSEKAKQWDDYVHRSPKTVAWQSYEWADVVAQNYKIDFHPLAALNDDRICGILPLYRVHEPGAPKRLIAVPYAVAGGLTADDTKVEAALLKQAIVLCNRLDLDGITLKQYRYPVEADMKNDRNYINRELNLKIGADAIREQLDERNKRRIESAERQQMEVEFPVSDQKEFYPVLIEHMTASGIPCPSRRWIQSLLDNRMYLVALVKKNGKVLAGTLLKQFRSTVSFPFSCLSDRSDTSLDALYFLYWKMIEKHSKEGYSIFHSGRMPLTEDVEDYRLGWGGRKHQYHYQYYPESGGNTEFQKKRGWKRRVFTTGWRMMPRSLASVIGPKIVKRFP